MAKRVIFSDEACADVRAIDRETALRLLKALARFLETDAGDVKQLEGFDLRNTDSASATGGISFANPATMLSRSCACGIGVRPTDETFPGSRGAVATCFALPIVALVAPL